MLGAVTSTVILVEGRSDAAALHALDPNLVDRDVRVVAMDGVTNFARFAGELAPTGIRLAGLCDVGEQRFVFRALERLGLPADGFFVCGRDLEEELLRALGTDRVLAIFDANDDLDRFRTFQAQPAKRDVAVEDQLHRFLGTTAGRKEKYARLLAAALEPDDIPAPLKNLLNFVR